MPLSKLEAELRMIARDRIATGELPCITPPVRMWGGYGIGRLCVVCDKTIEHSDVEYEVEANIKGETVRMWFHAACQSIWQLECGRAAYLKKHGYDYADDMRELAPRAGNTG